LRIYTFQVWKCSFYFRKQRHSISGATLSVNPTVNGDSGNVSQDEHDDDQERYFDKIARLKRTENEVNYSSILLQMIYSLL
jgi:hypothetical protein